MSCHIALPHYRSHLLHSLTSIRSLQGLKSCMGAFLRNGPKMRMPYDEKEDYLIEMSLRMMYQVIPFTTQDLKKLKKVILQMQFLYLKRHWQEVI